MQMRMGAGTGAVEARERGMPRMRSHTLSPAATRTHLTRRMDLAIGRGGR